MAGNESKIRNSNQSRGTSGSRSYSGNQPKQNGDRKRIGNKPQTKKRRLKKSVKKVILGIGSALVLGGIALAIKNADFKPVTQYNVPHTTGEYGPVYVIPEGKLKEYQGFVTTDGKTLDIKGADSTYDVYIVDTGNDGDALHVRTEKNAYDRNEIGEIYNGDHVIASEETEFGNDFYWKKVYNLDKGAECYVCSKYLREVGTVEEAYLDEVQDINIFDGKNREELNRNYYLAIDIEGDECKIPTEIFNKYYTLISDKKLKDYYIVQCNSKSKFAGQQILVRESDKGYVETIDGDRVPVDELDWENREKIDFKDAVTTQPKIEGQEEEFDRSTHELNKYLESDEYKVPYSKQEGGIKGIAISCNKGTFTPEQLRQLLRTDKSINYVILKLGATGYCGEDMRFVNSDTSTCANAKDYVRVCLETGIPYGFYYYSTAKSEEEGIKEADHIVELRDKIYEELVIGKHNETIPFTIDVEFGERNDRRENVSMDEITKAQIALYKRLKEKGTIGDKAIYYTPRESLTDFRELERKLKSEGIDLYVWVSDPDRKLAEGQHSNPNYTNIHGAKIPMVQFEISNTGYDVNYMNKKFAEKVYISDARETSEGWEIGDND